MSIKDMVAWQTATHNLERVAPLYNTPDTNVAVRWDGKEFNLESR